MSQMPAEDRTVAQLVVIPAAIASSACVGYRTVTSSQVLSPTMDRKMAPVTTIPTTMAASISKKCRQNGDKRRLPPTLAELAVAFREDGSERRRLRTPQWSPSVGELHRVGASAEADAQRQRDWQHPRCVRSVVVNRPSVTGAWRSWPSRR
jgi:hypothetical protein